MVRLRTTSPRATAAKSRTVINKRLFIGVSPSLVDRFAERARNVVESEDTRCLVLGLCEHSESRRFHRYAPDRQECRGCPPMSSCISTPDDHTYAVSRQAPYRNV